MVALPPILFEDKYLIAFDKPSGLLVAPDRWNKDVESLMQMIHERISPEIFNVHRLDKETSGVLLCAKTLEALRDVVAQFDAHTVGKRYLAITRGSPPEDEMTSTQALAEDRMHPGRMRGIASGGKPSETHLKVLIRWRGYALVEAWPKTERAHQIRVHLAMLRCPVLADSFYGGGEGLMLSDIKRRYKPKKNERERPLIGRLALHAQCLTLTHPIKRDILRIESPEPKAFRVAIKYLKEFAGL